MHTGYDLDFLCWKSNAHALNLNRCRNKREERKRRRKDGWTQFSCLGLVLDGWAFPAVITVLPPPRGHGCHTGPAATSLSLERKHSLGKQASKEIHTHTKSAHTHISTHSQCQHTRTKSAHTHKAHTHKVSTHTKSTHTKPNQTQHSQLLARSSPRVCCFLCKQPAGCSWGCLPSQSHTSANVEKSVSQHGELL